MKDVLKNKFTERLKELRRENNLSRQQLADCALNHNGMCTAEKIDVDDVLFGTKCKTRISTKEK